MTLEVLLLDPDPVRWRQTRRVLEHDLACRVIGKAPDIDHEDVSGARESSCQIALLEVEDAQRDAALQVKQARRLIGDKPLIALIGFGRTHLARLALAAGADDFLLKPVPLERLMLSMQQMVRLGTFRATAVVNGSAAQPEWTSLINAHGMPRALRDIEQEAIRFCVKFYGGSITKAARRLGVGRSTLYRKLEDA